MSTKQKSKKLKWLYIMILVILITYLAFGAILSIIPHVTPKPPIMIVEVDRLHESVTIENTTEDDRDLSGWQLVSVNGDQQFIFPDGTILESHERLIIASGSGTGDLFWTGDEIWLDTESDRAELYNREGEIVYDYDQNIIEVLESKSNELPKGLVANSIGWHDYDLLVYHTRDALYSYRPSDGTTKKLISEELGDGQWYTATGISRFCGVSPDRTKYILSTGMSHILQIHDFNTDELIYSFDFEEEEIYEAGWFDNEHIFLTTYFALFLVNIESGEQIQVSEDSSERFRIAGDADDYIIWARNVHRKEGKLFYNGVRGLNNLINSNIYCGDLSGEQILLKDADILFSVDEQRFVYIKQINYYSRVNDNYEGIFLYNLSTEESTLITKDHKMRDELFLTGDNEIAFIPNKTDEEPYYGVIFNPETLLFKRYKIPINELFGSDNVKDPYIHECLGAYRDEGAYVFLFGARNHIFPDYKSYAFNSTIDSIIEVEGSRFLISPSGDYIVATKHINEIVVNSYHHYKKQYTSSDVILIGDVMP